MAARVRFNFEFVFKSSPTIVYQFISSADCLTRWFCDDCNIIDDVFYFDWDGAEEVAYIIDDIEEERLRIQWEEYDDEYLEYILGRSEVTSATILEIHGFCEKHELNEERRFWEAKIYDLRRAMGE